MRPPNIQDVFPPLRGIFQHRTKRVHVFRLARGVSLLGCQRVSHAVSATMSNTLLRADYSMTNSIQRTVMPNHHPSHSSTITSLCLPCVLQLATSDPPRSSALAADAAFIMDGIQYGTVVGKGAVQLYIVKKTNNYSRIMNNIITCAAARAAVGLRY